MVRLSAPLALIGTNFAHVNLRLVDAMPTVRRRRHSPCLARSSNFDLSMTSPTYINAIGVPRGVPNEFELADQIAAGFENLPVVAALFPITPNKNVDRINYVQYNVLRLGSCCEPPLISGCPGLWAAGRVWVCLPWFRLLCMLLFWSLVVVVAFLAFFRLSSASFRRLLSARTRRR